MKKLISVRLEEEDIASLLTVARPRGGIGRWITIKLHEEVRNERVSTACAEVIDKLPVPVEPAKVIKTKDDAVYEFSPEVARVLVSKAYTPQVRPSPKVEHSPTCNCFMCKPPKEG